MKVQKLVCELNNYQNEKIISMVLALSK